MEQDSKLHADEENPVELELLTCVRYYCCRLFPNIINVCLPHSAVWSGRNPRVSHSEQV